MDSWIKSDPNKLFAGSTLLIVGALFLIISCFLIYIGISKKDKRLTLRGLSMLLVSVFFIGTKLVLAPYLINL